MRPVVRWHEDDVLPPYLVHRVMQICHRWKDCHPSTAAAAVDGRTRWNAPVIVIDGRSGSGKTSLANQLAAALQAQDPSGVQVLHLGGAPHGLRVGADERHAALGPHHVGRQAGVQLAAAHQRNHRMQRGGRHRERDAHHRAGNGTRRCAETAIDLAALWPPLRRLDPGQRLFAGLCLLALAMQRRVTTAGVVALFACLVAGAAFGTVATMVPAAKPSKVSIAVRRPLLNKSRSRTPAAATHGLPFQGAAARQAALTMPLQKAHSASAISSSIARRYPVKPSPTTLPLAAIAT